MAPWHAEIFSGISDQVTKKVINEGESGDITPEGHPSAVIFRDGGPGAGGRIGVISEVGGSSVYDETGRRISFEVTIKGEGLFDSRVDGARVRLKYIVPSE